MGHKGILLNDGVAFTCLVFECTAIQNLYCPTTVFNDVHSLKKTGCLGHAGPVRAKHGRKKIVSDAKRPGMHSVVSHKQPAGETSIDVMQAITGCRLRNM